MAAPHRARRAPRSARRAERFHWLTALALLAAAVGAVQFVHPSPQLFRRPFADGSLLPFAHPSPDAYGRSGEVKLRVALPGEPVEFPLAVVGDPTAIRYAWVHAEDTAGAPVDSVRALAGATVRAPADPGFYKLLLLRGERRQVVAGLTVGVLVPFREKLGSPTLNGYNIGTYLAEKLGGRHDHPEGFLPVEPQDLGLQITKHLQLSDFVAHDGQDTWPRYVALNPRLLDKLELVVRQIAEERGAADSTLEGQVAVDVHSGFRTPRWNRRVPRSARDSRHQYGDAADVAIDADGNGRLDAKDTRLVARAVEEVEREHPDLVGGMGLYTSGRYRTPYVHIDARGKRARWRG